MKRFFTVVMVILLPSLVMLSCGDDNSTTTTDCSKFSWEYTGDGAPANWGNCYADCKGTSQSPIDITGATTDATLTTLDTHYEDAPIELVNNGHTEEFEYEAGSKVVVDGLDYNLLQFHFHTKSEHTVAGKQYPMEVHLVHKNTVSGNLAVIGVFFEEGAENAVLQNFIDSLPKTKDAKFESAMKISAKNLLPATGSYFTYSGSLTTPPCSQIVKWFVMKTPITASAAQISKMSAIIHNNNRPIQSLFARVVKQFN